MQLIKDKQVTQDSWVFIADDAPLNADFNIVSQSRWRKEKAKLISQKGALGLRLESDTAVEDIVGDLKHFQLIELHIPVFTDGRAFTQARLLRSRFGFTGDIRVSGDFMRDQVFYLSRVGVSSFELNDQEDAQGIITSMEDFSVDYQESVA
ncbi:DUF934 domain-containing protein [methanotrophic endosymbiont of Bathymodiolus puteoserpentis (Logatchev)]|jgi:uncharacterized protein (DUF934 family)|uniref:DUF934 domain-containing protein n=1 Tax=methanotrophic endosymbiont of Bathymodiolus puteoserpentis (Logatchev) TaxID=343235 RepID=UPI0013CDCB1B|nr:DUF934 domain-containing protein [methanotrophic endosymbiont of Bathymodiolus puteoserpentis (Logatchev)]SHE20266.1 Oxidoreductase probably involved in sulfite reduction [methanotrophic endosymbiont of Bathymodiolus puteoserpentis (Logatchev)]